MRIATTSIHHPFYARRRTISIPFGAQRFLAMFEGIEGGFAIGTSVILALSFANLPLRALLISAFVSMLVGGFNSASVRYSSEHFLDELDGREKRSPFRNYFIPAFIEFISYALISFLTILPVILLANLHVAIAISVVLNLAILFGAGYWRGFVVQMKPVRDGLETMLLGAFIMLVGLVSGYIIQVLSVL